MGFFIFRTKEEREHDESLEKALASIRFSEEFKIKTSGNGEDKKTVTESPAYWLPVDTENGNMVGIFKLEEGLARARIGFSQQTGLTTKSYYEFSSNRLRKIETIKKDVLYIPLMITSIFEIIGPWEGDKFTPNPNAPFPVMGIEGKDGLHQIILSHESEKGLGLYGFYKISDEKVGEYYFYKNTLGKLIERNPGLPKFLKDIKTEFR